MGRTINNDFYDQLGDGWYSDTNHPIALLRAENAIRVPWIASEISNPSKVLDIGCGAGFLTNPLAQNGHTVFGIDLSQTSLEIAKKRDATQKVTYEVANAYCLPYSDESFDVVCAMDVLEHVDHPQLLIAEASRVLKKGGQFFFHTFNRNFLSYLMIIKGVEWCVPNTPKNMHVYPLFIKPEELADLLENEQLTIQKVFGFRPKINRPFFKMVFTRKIPVAFEFCFSKNLMTGYCGSARKI